MKRFLVYLGILIFCLAFWFGVFVAIANAQVFSSENITVEETVDSDVLVAGENYTVLNAIRQHKYELELEEKRHEFRLKELEKERMVMQQSLVEKVPDNDDIITNDLSFYEDFNCGEGGY